MRAKLAKLLALFSDVEESCGCASLSLSTTGGKSIFKFVLETPPSPATTTTTSRSPTLPSAPDNQAAGRQRRRNRGAAGRARRNQRATASQVTLAEVNSPPASSPPCPPRPLHHLLSPSISTGRRRVMSLGRLEMLTFSSLNLDGSSSPSSTPTPSTPSPGDLHQHHHPHHLHRHHLLEKLEMMTVIVRVRKKKVIMKT